jgi:hypothetical protein
MSIQRRRRSVEAVSQRPSSSDPGQSDDGRPDPPEGGGRRDAEAYALRVGVSDRTRGLSLPVQFFRRPLGVGTGSSSPTSVQSMTLASSTLLPPNAAQMNRADRSFLVLEPGPYS